MNQSCEPLKIKEETGDILEFYLTKDKTPVAYERKKYELINQSGMSEKEAEDFLRTTVFVFEIFYSLGQGAFAVESEAVENCEIYNPYTGEEISNENLIYKNSDT